MRPLFHEHCLPLVIAKASQVAIIGPVKELSPSVGTHATKKIPLIVAVQVHLEGLATSTVALQKSALDVWLANRRQQGRCPVLGRKQIVDLAVSLHQAGPAH